MSLSVVKKLSLVILMMLSQLIDYVTLESDTECKVLVDDPWPRDVLAPENSTILINCTTPSDSPLWSIDLASDGSNLQLQFSNRAEDLNAHGVYELPTINETGMLPTLRLLINETSSNNGTKIVCDDENESFITTLYVYDPAEYNLSVQEISKDFINILWSSQTPVQNSSFLLTISNFSTSNVVILNNPFYLFTTPKDVPPCEVYNFSVTTTHVGATYTGAGCSIPSPALSVMLPSLPDIDKMERSIEYTLAANSFGELILNVSLESATSCEQYPVVNYTLEVKGPMPEADLVSYDYVSKVTQIFIVDSNLSENAVYSFRVLVANTVGVASTSNITFYTTDVQMVTANTEGGNTATVQCVFLMGSNARGCMVLLMSLHGEESQILTRNKTTNLAMSTITLNYVQSCYHGVEAFDVESDGTVGSLAVPGMLFRNVGTGNNPSEPCEPSSSQLRIVLIVVLTVMLVTIVAVIIMMFVFTKMYFTKSRRSSQHSQAEAHNSELRLVHYEDITDFPTSHVEISSCPNQEEIDHLYEQPNRKGDCKVEDSEAGYSRTAYGIKNQNVTTDMAEHKTYSKLNIEVDSKADDSEAGYSRTEHGIKNQNETTDSHMMTEDMTYSKLNEEEHFYHTLESSRKPCGIEVTIPEAQEPSDDQLQTDHDLSSNPSHLNSTTAGDSHKSMELNDKDTHTM